MRMDMIVLVIAALLIVQAGCHVLPIQEHRLQVVRFVTKSFLTYHFNLCLLVASYLFPF